MRIRSRNRRLSAEVFETRCLLTAVPTELTLVTGPADIYSERDGWEHIDFEEIPGIQDLIDLGGLQATDMAFLRNDEGHVLVRGTRRK